MGRPDDDGVVQIADWTLSRQECLGLLRTTTCGRVAYSDRAMPAIALVTYSVVDGALLIHAAAGQPTTIALRGTVVAFEADGSEPFTRTGWSVTCVGKAAPVPGRPDVLLLEPTRVRGSRFTVPAALAT